MEQIAGPPGRPGRGHLRQPSLRGPGGDRRSGRRGGGGRRRAGRVPGRGRPPGRHPGRPGHGRAGDAVLIAGKGHEQGQEFAGGRKVPFDDRQVAAEEPARALPGVRPGGPHPFGAPRSIKLHRDPRTKGPHRDPAHLGEVAEATWGRLAGVDPDAVVTGVAVDFGSSVTGSCSSPCPAAAPTAACSRPPPPRPGGRHPGPGGHGLRRAPASRSPTCWPPWPPSARPSGGAVGGHGGRGHRVQRQDETKDLLAAALGTRLTTVANQASFNNEVGLPRP